MTEVRRQVAVLRRELRFGRAWLIGSIAWGGFGVRSDVDLVVEAADGNVVHEVAERLGEATGRAVDVLAFETLPASFQSRILADGLDVA